MSRIKPTLEEFLAMEHVPNLYIWFGTIECYMRKGRILVDGKIYSALTIANVTNRRRGRGDNSTFNPKHKRTGLFKEFETHVRDLSLKHGYDGVYVEQVLNEFLPSVLERYGYRRVNMRGDAVFMEQNYWFEHERSG